MKIPVIHGYIERRLLINYTADPEIISGILPTPFRPKLYKGKAIVGICLIRLKHIKPKGLPDILGIGSENAAHRIAVEWDEGDIIKEGVYIPRRDTSSRINSIAGGRIFPGKHHLATFEVKENRHAYHIDILSSDQTSVSISAEVASAFTKESIFGTLDEVADFFEKGCDGYSPNGKGFDGLRLHTYQWKVTPLTVGQVSSSFFENQSIFPENSIRFDNAILMENIEHEWHSLPVKIK
ncbi:MULTISPECIES: DUF2071 domain-containing protein [unclassified Sphingobacterium]|uniref:DUF2071 domain-containing protein n=1 Tax=unclassified Sphingobacterium TaxID=2609468 RepID=UPI0025D066A9|nr:MULTISPECIES: DUF2071 domain-containing protein [unclassified Sphingobacterium]